uniref:C2H2-type domain-containing protein n=1 Tax=Glossina pallidipes TaxID=7398 RepID=A0A1A9ZHX8_GLOPL
MAESLRVHRDYTAQQFEDHVFFTCPECGVLNKTQKEWRRHLNEEHDYVHKKGTDFNYEEIANKIYECRDCSKLVDARDVRHTTSILQYHRFTHLPYPRRYSCRHCLKDFTQKKTLYMHLDKLHGSMLSGFGQQHRKAEAASVEDPRLNAEFYMRFLCPLCGKHFDRHQKWRQHIDTNHSNAFKKFHMKRINNNDYCCTLCQLILTDNPTRSQLQRHYFTHLQYQMYFKCAFCSTRKCYKTEVLLHYINVHLHTHPNAKGLLKIPKEWGGEANIETVRELNELLRIILQQKNVNVKQELSVSEELRQQNPIKKSHELENLEQEVEDSALEETVDNSFFLQNEISDRDLEEICKAMFEETDSDDDDRDDDLAGASMPFDPKFERLKAKDSTKLKSDEWQKFLNYLCPECGQEFEDQIVWRNHVFTDHNLSDLVFNDFRPLNAENTSYLCLICSKTLATNDFNILKHHHFKHAPNKSYLKCKLCGERQSNKIKMFQHLQINHGDQIIAEHECSLCGNRFESRGSLRKHYEQCLITDDSFFPSGNIEENKRILEHLENAGERLRTMLMDMGEDPDMMPMPMECI